MTFKRCVEHWSRDVKWWHCDVQSNLGLFLILCSASSLSVCTLISQQAFEIPQ